MKPQQLFEEHRPLLERAATLACRRRRLRQEDAEEFLSLVWIKLIDDDYAVFRKFKGKASLATYLVTVIHRLLQDYMNSLWGKWRPSAEARRSGPVAELLDRLTTRDGLGFDEACEVLRNNHDVDLSWQQLWEIYERLPHRHPRPVEDPEPLATLASSGQSTDRRAIDRERATERTRLWRAFEEILARQPDEDQLLLRLSVEQSWSDIARARRKPYKQLYRHLRGLYETLRRELEAEGFASEDVLDLLGPGPWDEGESSSSPLAVPPRGERNGGRSVYGGER